MPQSLFASFNLSKKPGFFDPPQQDSFVVRTSVRSILRTEVRTTNRFLSATEERTEVRTTNRFLQPKSGLKSALQTVFFPQPKSGLKSALQTVFCPQPKSGLKSALQTVFCYDNRPDMISEGVSDSGGASL
ncbi:MAG: hypothetical protein EAZ60_19735 [Oscillatoriales cyanobacterium]|nr:MAG: hypothetical protein EAZ83_02105 [Oscillatoriales cyanobacterium]TAE98409.1 MAG: hypothetical protein EAZ79_07725 [Oscillatoriales cyanobacterium]TAF23327.1 MAG: hypothetical protein EAZ73_02445 [Oscillatoriales cyanobacterium]TAF35600.1 MAG: hypothetical protein EAZ69_12730 [Oscillatoriales cyanobacterium]TAF53609.1 MAG: hypothetical protein EAZ60_19735 [Oscillatoriales cyanobacterium]